MSEPHPVVVALSARGLDTARRIQAALDGAELHGRAGRVADADVAFADTAAHLRELYAYGRPIVAVCASGIVIRALASLLDDKRAEPPVLAVAETGTSVVPLLGGHRGANRLAERIAWSLRGHAAVTTASELAFGVGLDEPPAGWTLANPGDAKAAAAALLAGQHARIDPRLDWLRALPQADDGAVAFTATVRRTAGDAATLVYHPRALAVGVGCERGCDADELVALVRETLQASDLAEAAVGAVVSLDLKMDEPAVHAAAAALGAPARFFDAARLEAETPRLATPSDAVYREVGCHGVAEGAALAAAGAAGRLLAAKRKSARATCAIAEAPAPLDPDAVGRRRGRLAVVGLGPGDAAMQTPEARGAVDAATDLVGYRLYIDLLGARAHGKTRHDFDLGEEEARVRHALELAAAGRDVALVCSGDPGIYAMASPLFELLKREDRADWNRVAVTVVPGISALQAAAARAGAPLGHDFCAISLSDLLTPWETIRARVEAAAQGDFVVAFYNPVSRKRHWQLGAAAEILRAHRPPHTPVMLARNLGRDGERLDTLTLAELDPAQVDMLTVVLVGASQTRALPRGDGGRWIYTPRGYAGKGAAADTAADTANVPLNGSGDAA